jgi:hypothetical protein
MKDKIIKQFRNEFTDKVKIFTITDVNSTDIYPITTPVKSSTSIKEIVAKPGVYVWYDEKQIIRV